MFKNRIPILMTLGVVLCLSTTAGVAADGPTFDSSLLTWSAEPGYRLILTVSGGGQIQRYEFEAGHPATFSILDPTGKVLADDSYTWQLTASPVLSGVGFFESGYFTVSGGAFVTPSALEDQANKDEVINDDLIVDGSACIGVDCVDGEVFGTDTLRLKANNLRIHFQDTSTTTSLPTNDWRLTVNDSIKGGADRFSIDDVDGNNTPFTIEAGAPDHSLYVDDGGSLGLGTATPGNRIDIQGDTTPGLRITNTATAGGSWDMRMNEITKRLVFRENTGAVIPLKIASTAQTNLLQIGIDAVNTEVADLVTVDGDLVVTGTVGVGTTSPDSNLDIEAGTPELRLSGTTADEQWEIRVNDVGRLNFQNQGTGNTVLRLGSSANAELLSLGVKADDEVAVDGNLILRTGKIGLGTATPASDLEIEAGTPELRLDGTTSGETWEMRVNDAGRVVFQNQGTGNSVLQIDPDANANLLQVGRQAADQVNIAGNLVISGTCTGCDAVFTDDFPLESIEEHAASMWANSYLPGVGATQEGSTSINVFEKVTGILQELEKAHIYIEQIHNRLQDKEAQVDQLRQELTELRELVEAR